jgi:hypothetical protein
VAAAREKVMRLDEPADPLDAGSLAESWRQQPGTPACGADLGAAAATALAAAEPCQYRKQADDSIRATSRGSSRLA